MRIPFREIKRSDYFKESRVIAGFSGTDNVVEYINVVDSQFDYMQFQVPNSLVIVSGWVNNFENEEKRCELLRNLKDTGAAALGIYEYEFETGYPEDLLQLAEELSLPVLTLKIDQIYPEIIKYFSEYMYIRLYRAFMSRDEAQDLLMRCFKGDKIRCICNKLWELSGCEVSIKFYQQEMYQGKRDCQWFLERRKDWEISELNHPMLKVDSPLYRYKVLDGEETVHWIGYHEVVNGEITKVYWLMLDSEILDEQVLRLYYYGYKSLQIEFKKRDYEFMMENKRLMALLLGGSQGEQAHAESGRQSYVKYDRAGRVLIFNQSLPDCSYTELHRHLGGVLTECGLLQSQVVLSNHQGSLVLIVSDVKEANQISQVATRLLEYGGYLFERGNSVKVGIGSYAQRESLDQSYRKAKKVTHWMKRSGPSIGVYEDLGLVRFLDTEDEELLEYLNRRYIDPLRSYDRDNGAELLHSTKVYVDNRWSFVDAAKQLFIHANSVKYRINQVKEILRDDLMLAGTRTELEMALALDDFLNREECPIEE